MSDLSEEEDNIRGTRPDKDGLPEYSPGDLPYYYGELLNLSRLYKDFQATRKASDERIRAIIQGRARGSPNTFLNAVSATTEAIERKTAASIKILVRKHPVWYDWLINVHGVGDLAIGQLLGVIGVKQHADGSQGIGCFPTISKFWRYCGVGQGQYYIVNGRAIAPVVGKRWVGEGKQRHIEEFKPEQPAGSKIEFHIDKKIPGILLPWDEYAKVICLNYIGDCIIRANGAYRTIYDAAKEDYHRKHTDWSNGHCDNAANRVMTKIFLSHLWLQWREYEGLPTRSPWVHEYGGHTTEYRWQDFIEPKSSANSTADA